MVERITVACPNCGYFFSQDMWQEKYMVFCGPRCEFNNKRENGELRCMKNLET